MCQLAEEILACTHSNGRQSWFPDTAEACENAQMLASYDKHGKLQRCTEPYLLRTVTVVPGYCRHNRIVNAIYNFVFANPPNCRKVAVNNSHWTCTCGTTMAPTYPEDNRTCSGCGAEFNHRVNTILYDSGFTMRRSRKITGRIHILSDGVIVYEDDQ